MVSSFGGTMDDTCVIRVLLVGDSPQSFFLHQKHLERNGCDCEFAESERTAWEMLGRRQFDLVLSLHTRRGTSNPSLGILLRGSQTTLFHALRLEVGCWWVPILRLGEECASGRSCCDRESLPTHSMRHSWEIRADAKWRENPIQTGRTRGIRLGGRTRLS